MLRDGRAAIVDLILKICHPEIQLGGLLRFGTFKARDASVFLFQSGFKPPMFLNKGSSSFLHLILQISVLKQQYFYALITNLTALGGNWILRLQYGSV